MQRRGLAAWVVSAAVTLLVSAGAIAIDRQWEWWTGITSIEPELLGARCLPRALVGGQLCVTRTGDSTHGRKGLLTWPLLHPRELLRETSLR